MLSKKSKIEQLPKSRERQCLPAAASASLCQMRTKLYDRLLVIRGGPSHQRARHAPAALKNLVHLSEKPFSTASTHRRRRASTKCPVSHHCICFAPLMIAASRARSSSSAAANCVGVLPRTT